LTSALDEVSGQLHAPIALFPGEESPVPVGWVRPKIGLDFMEKRKIFSSYRESNPSRPARIYNNGTIPISFQETYHANNNDPVIVCLNA
jgi:hypothetical protein